MLQSIHVRGVWHRAATASSYRQNTMSWHASFCSELFNEGRSLLISYIVITWPDQGQKMFVVSDI